jgi:sRNA-binding carbon storage regulator CsrA
MWKTKLTSKDNHIQHEILVGDDTTIRMVRSGEGVLSIVVDAPRSKTIVRRAGVVICAPFQEG